MRFCAKLIFLLLLFAATARADSLSGTLLDANGNRVAGAFVTVCSTGSVGIPCTPVLQTGMTAGDGSWFFIIAAGTYDISFVRAGIISTKITQATSASPSGVVNLNSANVFTGANSFLWGGAFTNTQEQQNFVFNTNSLATNNMFPQVQSGHSTTGLVTGVNIPSSSTAQNVQGLGAYVLNNSTTSYGVGAYIQATCNANTTKCTGVNPLGVDVAGLTTGVQLAGMEVDTQPQNASSAYAGINGILDNLFAPQAGAFGTAFTIGAPQVGQWNLGFLVNDGAINSATFVALRIGQQTTGVGATSSQLVQFKSANGAANIFSSINTDSVGSFHFNVPSGQLTFTNVGGTNFANAIVIGSGTAVMTVAAIGAGACGATVTVPATNVATTDAIAISEPGAPSGGANGSLTIHKWPTANNVNFAYCNPTAGSITPVASTLNWRVVR